MAFVVPKCSYLGQPWLWHFARCVIARLVARDLTIASTDAGILIPLTWADIHEILDEDKVGEGLKRRIRKHALDRNCEAIPFREGHARIPIWRADDSVAGPP